MLRYIFHDTDAVQRFNIVNAMLRALLVTPDDSLVRTFAKLSRELGIEAYPSSRTAGMPDELQHAKYEAVLLDFDRVPDANNILTTLRQSASGKSSVIFALVSDAARRQGVLQSGASLIVERPIEESQIRRALHAAFDLMARERRRYFRCSAKFPALLIPANSDADFRCSSINVSSAGIALTAPLSLAPGDEVQVIFRLPVVDSLLRAIGTVIWDDKHGKTGLSFKCTRPEYQNDLEVWLDRQLLNSLSSEQNTD